MTVSISQTLYKHIAYPQLDVLVSRNFSYIFPNSVFLFFLAVAIMLLTGACRWLTTLGLAESRGLTSECFSALAYAPAITDLDLSLNTFVADEGLTLIASRVTALTALDISGCGLVTDKGVESIASLKELRLLDLSGNLLVTDASIITLSDGCPRLSSLKCMLMPALSGKSIQAVGGKCQELRVLDVSYVALVSDIALRSVVRCCKGLVDLNLAWCESLSKSSFTYIAQFCHALENLNVSATKIGDEEILAIMDKCGRLLELSIIDCRNITPTGIDTVLSQAKAASRHIPVKVFEKVKDRI